MIMKTIYSIFISRSHIISKCQRCNENMHAYKIQPLYILKNNKKYQMHLFLGLCFGLRGVDVAQLLNSELS